MKKLFIRRTSFVFCFLILSFIPSLAQVKSYFGTTPDLKVSGKEFVDPNGRPVSLHGVMDTPNCYFNGGRWGWIDYNNPSTSNLNACKNYFTKVFEALTPNIQKVISVHGVQVLQTEHRMCHTETPKIQVGV